MELALPRVIRPAYDAAVELLLIMAPPDEMPVPLMVSGSAVV